MNFSKIFILVVTLFLVSFSLTANASNNANKVITAQLATDGGPRDVVQTMVDVEVVQLTPTNLYITIVDSDGETAIEQCSGSTQTTICTLGLEEGSYTIKTVDDNGDYQEFSIEI